MVTDLNNAALTENLSYKLYVYMCCYIVYSFLKSLSITLSTYVEASFSNILFESLGISAT